MYLENKFFILIPCRTIHIVHAYKDVVQLLMYCFLILSHPNFAFFGFPNEVK